MKELVPEGNCDRRTADELFDTLTSLDRKVSDFLDVKIDGVIASKLANILRCYVARKLVEKGILIETCPTSNWRIVTGLSSPTEHPIGWWINTMKGDYRVGTDDPATLPCTIGVEYYSVERSKAYHSGSDA